MNQYRACTDQTNTTRRNYQTTFHSASWALPKKHEIEPSAACPSFLFWVFQGPRKYDIYAETTKLMST
jgi:hypothetical protein